MHTLVADGVGPITLLDEHQRPFVYDIHIAVDSFGKFLFTSLIQQVTSDTIQECFEKVFLLLGICQVLFTDRGTDYASEEFANFLRPLNICHFMPPPNRPFVLGQAESFVKEVKHKLKFIMDTNPKTWHKSLDALTSAINST